MFMLTFLHQIFFKLCFCLQDFIKNVRLLLAIVSVNGLITRLCAIPYPDSYSNSKMESFRQTLSYIRGKEWGFTFRWRRTIDSPPQCQTFIQQPGQPTWGSSGDLNLQTNAWEPSIVTSKSWKQNEITAFIHKEVCRARMTFI